MTYIYWDLIGRLSFFFFTHVDDTTHTYKYRIPNVILLYEMIYLWALWYNNIGVTSFSRSLSGQNKMCSNLKSWLAAHLTANSINMNAVLQIRPHCVILYQTS